MKQRPRNPYVEGQIERKRGKPQSDCPYKAPGMLHRRRWIAGHGAPDTPERDPKAHP